MNILAQIMGLLANVGLIISNQQKSKAKILLIQVITNILFIGQYMLLNAFAGAIVAGIALIRISVFYIYEKYNLEISKKVLYIFLLITLISGIYTYENVYSFLAIFAACIYTYAIWQNDLYVYRKCETVNAICWIIYNFIVGAYVGAIGSVCEALSAIYAIYKYDYKKK